MRIPDERYGLRQDGVSLRLPRFIDANCMLGRYNLFRPGSFYTKERLLKEMGYYGISEALVFHAVSMENSPQLGNRLILDEVSDAPSLHPVWSILPPVSGGSGQVESMVDGMLKNGVRVVRLFPLQFHFNLDDWCFGEIFDVLSERKMPVMIDYFDPLTPHADRTDWQSIVSVCRRYPELPIIASEFRFRTNRRLCRAMDACPNLHVELSGLWLFRAVELICREFGADRLLFGTRLPIRDPSCSLGMVNYAMISEEEKEMVAGKNLARLMGV